MQCGNLVVERTEDLAIIAPTGSGKSVCFSLALHAQKRGISVVITPYTTLGKEGANKYVPLFLDSAVYTYLYWISNHGTGVESMFVHSNNKDRSALDRLLCAEMVVIYACAEMLESPTLAPLWLWETYKRISAFYVDEGHCVHESASWRPSYTRIWKLRNLIKRFARDHGETIHIPIIVLSATCPSLYRESLVTHLGMSPDYKLINLGNFRPELSHVIINMQHPSNSFQDLAFLLPLNSRLTDLVPTLGYCDNLELLTKLYWWFNARLASMDMSQHLVDIIHAGLSETHQDMVMTDFRSGKIKILLGSDKIGAGLNLGCVDRVFQYQTSGLTVPKWDQRRGRGGRKPGSTSVGFLFVEPKMAIAGGLTVEDPGDEDPGMVDLAQSGSHVEVKCAEAVIDRWLENPPHEHVPLTRRCCSNCHHSLIPGQELQWVHENPAPSTSATVVGGTVRTTGPERLAITEHLKKWRLTLWQAEWREKWPSYGPKALVNDVDLENLANRAGSSVFILDDIRKHTRVVHWSELSGPLLTALQQAYTAVLGPEFLLTSNTVIPSDPCPPPPAIVSTPQTIATPTQRQVRALGPYESIMTYM
jgi:hypothetical protein